jgi:hypothetical protein
VNEDAPEANGAARMNVFESRQKVIKDYGDYGRSFISIRGSRSRAKVDGELASGLLWPKARIGLDPAFAEGAWIDGVVALRLRVHIVSTRKDAAVHQKASEVLRAHERVHEAARTRRVRQRVEPTAGRELTAMRRELGAEARFECLHLGLEPLDARLQLVQFGLEGQLVEPLLHSAESLFHAVEALLHPVEAVFHPIEPLLHPVKPLLYPVEALLDALQACHEGVVLDLEPIEPLVDRVEMASKLGAQPAYGVRDQALHVRHGDLAVKARQGRDRERVLSHAAHPTAHPARRGSELRLGAH